MHSKDTRSDAPTRSRLEPVRESDLELPNEASGVSLRQRKEDGSEPPTVKVSSPPEEPATVRVESPEERREVGASGNAPSSAHPVRRPSTPSELSVPPTLADLFADSPQTLRLRRYGSVAFVTLGAVVALGTLWAIVRGDQKLEVAPLAPPSVAEPARTQPDEVEAAPPVVAPAQVATAADVAPAHLERTDVTAVVVAPAEAPVQHVAEQEQPAMQAPFDADATLAEAQATLRADHSAAAAEQVRAQLAQVIAERPDNPHAHAALASACLRLRDAECALAAVKRAVRLRPKRAEYRELEASVRSALGLPPPS